MPWEIVQYDKLPGPKVLDAYEKDGWEIFQIIHYQASDKVYVYLRRNIIVASGNGQMTRQQRREIARKAGKDRRD